MSARVRKMMSDLTIKEASKEVTAWSKDITFEREGKTYSVTLYWDSYDGYDITFKNKTNSTPKWAKDLYDYEDSNGDENLYEILDNLTEKEAE
jgi:hypothetical protein